MTDAATTPNREAGGGRGGRPDRAPVDTSSPFYRIGGRLRFTARTATVLATSTPAPGFVRVSFGGPDFADFTSRGPTDHVRVFFPDPATGELIAPTPIGPGEDGIVRPEGRSHARDFTPLAPRTLDDGTVCVDIDFFLHADPGPASGWAERATIGDHLVIVGPRGSSSAPAGVDGAILVCDETSLPAVSRWVRELPLSATIDIVAAVSGDGTWISDYLGTVDEDRVRIHVTAPDASSQAALSVITSLGPIGAGTLVWAAGEASALVPVRRHLRRTLSLPPVQVGVSGYWRRGEVGYDHHSPVDPTDPD